MRFAIYAEPLGVDLKKSISGGFFYYYGKLDLQSLDQYYELLKHACIYRQNDI